MELLTTSILTLLALYVIYSEPFKLPTIIKKNKKLSYIIIIGLYLYYLHNNIEGAVEGLPRFLPRWWDNPGHILAVFLLTCIGIAILNAKIDKVPSLRRPG
jgi:hypothetical protein